MNLAHANLGLLLTVLWFVLQYHSLAIVSHCAHTLHIANGIDAILMTLITAAATNGQQHCGVHQLFVLIHC